MTPSMPRIISMISPRSIGCLEPTSTSISSTGSDRRTVSDIRDPVPAAVPVQGPGKIDTFRRQLFILSGDQIYRRQKLYMSKPHAVKHRARYIIGRSHKRRHFFHSAGQKLLSYTGTADLSVSIHLAWLDNGFKTIFLSESGKKLRGSFPLESEPVVFSDRDQVCMKASDQDVPYKFFCLD